MNAQVESSNFRTRVLRGRRQRYIDPMDDLFDRDRKTERTIGYGIDKPLVAKQTSQFWLVTPPLAAFGALTSIVGLIAYAAYCFHQLR